MFFSPSGTDSLCIVPHARGPSEEAGRFSPSISGNLGPFSWPSTSIGRKCTELDGERSGGFLEGFAPSERRRGLPRVARAIAGLFDFDGAIHYRRLNFDFLVVATSGYFVDSFLFSALESGACERARLGISELLLRNTFTVYYK